MTYDYHDDLYCLIGDDPANDLPADTPRCAYCGDTTPEALSEWLDADELCVWVCDHPLCKGEAHERGMVRK